MKNHRIGVLMIGTILAVGAAGWVVYGTAPEPAAAGMRASAGDPAVGQAAEDGSALYAAHCASCHGDTKKGSSAAATQSAIAANTGEMGALKFLTPAQLAAIAAGR